MALVASAMTVPCVMLSSMITFPAFPRAASSSERYTAELLLSLVKKPSGAAVPIWAAQPLVIRSVFLSILTPRAAPSVSGPERVIVLPRFRYTLFGEPSYRLPVTTGLPLILNVPLLYTPPPQVAEFPVIVPPVMVKTPVTNTPPPEPRHLPPVILPVLGLLLSVRVSVPSARIT